MKYLNEYRDPAAMRGLLDLIAQEMGKTTRRFRIMEVCGGQTHNLVKYGILNRLPKNIEVIHGPGCPVCVTPMKQIDRAIELSLEPDTLLCTYGDMVRVPGSDLSLADARSQGGSIQIIQSPLEAVELAKQSPGLKIVLFAVGFETTAPATALAVDQAFGLGLKNFFTLMTHVRVPPAIELILKDRDCQIDGFLAAGHVCTVMGTGEYDRLADHYRVPIVVTGFEPLDLLVGIKQLVAMLAKDQAGVVNEYSRVVSGPGNVMAQNLLEKVFEIGDQDWRGLGVIKNGGLVLRDEYMSLAIGDDVVHSSGASSCQAGAVLTGKIKPDQCPHFGAACTPEQPLGAPMVSTEGACAAYFQYGKASPAPTREVNRVVQS